MRRVAYVTPPREDVRRLILYKHSDDAVYVFSSRSVDDSGPGADEWFMSVEDAEAYATERFGITSEMWQALPDPEPFCQHDCLVPTRVKGRDKGQPQWGELERLIEGVWVPWKPGQT